MSVFIGYLSFMAYQMMKGKGNNDGFPSIPGMIARYSALGLTNEQMKENPVWVDKTGNGHDLQMKNFAWSGMSGVGGYVQDFNYFKNNATVDKVRIDEQNSNSIKVTTLTTGINNTIYIPKNIYQFNKPYFIKISSEGYNEGDLSLLFYAPSTSTVTTVKVPLNPNGITEIPAIKEDDFLAVYLNVGGKVGSFTVEQLPLYHGALVFDGVDDYGTCDNFPILTKEKGYTVVALRQWIEEKNSITALVSNSKNWNQDGAFIFEYNNLENNFPNIEISFGSNNMFDRGLSPYSYQTSKSYNGNLIESGSFLGSDKLVVAKANENLSPNSNIAIWELVFLDHDATEEELTKIKDYYKKEYPWLFSDQAWTVTGKTNEDTDRDTIANITGNGNNLVLSNLGFIEGSGYNEEGEYAGYLVTDGVDDQIRSSAITMGKDFTVVTESILIQPTKNNVTGIVKPSSFTLYNYIVGVNTYINRTGTGYLIRGTRTIKALSSDGRLYSEDWSEHIDNTEQTVSSSTGSLTVGYSVYGVAYTKLAFKNLAIYPTVLSKDDCIKAYNYLQTLKAK